MTGLPDHHHFTRYEILPGDGTVLREIIEHDDIYLWVNWKQVARVLSEELEMQERQR